MLNYGISSDSKEKQLAFLDFMKWECLIMFENKQRSIWMDINDTDCLSLEEEKNC